MVNITSNVTGCIHDYELTTDNLRTLSDADVLFINGGGMEEFTLKATESVKTLKYAMSRLILNMHTKTRITGWILIYTLIRY